MTSRLKAFVAASVATLTGAAMVAAAVLIAPSVALAADSAAPTGTVADWAYTAPWAAGSGNGGDCVSNDGRVGTLGVWDAATSACAIPATGVVPTVDPQYVDAYLGLGQVRFTSGLVDSAGSGSAWAAVNFRMDVAQSSFTLDLASRVPGLTGRFYAEAGDRSTGTATTDVYGNPLRTLRGFPFTVTAVPGGVRVNTQMGAISNPWESHTFTVVAERTDGSRMRIGVAVGSLDYGGRPSANGLTYTVPVGETLNITKEDLAAAAVFHSGVDTDVVIDTASLPASVTATDDGVSFISEAPVTDSFAYRAEEVQAPMTSRIASDAAAVTITAVANEPPVVEPPVTVPPVVVPSTPEASQPPVSTPEVPKRITTGDGLPVGLLVGLGIAVVGIAVSPLLRRFARR